MGYLIAARKTITKLYERRKYEKLWQQPGCVVRLAVKVKDLPDSQPSRVSDY